MTASNQTIDPTILPDFDSMPNVALMDTSKVDKNQPPFILVDGSYYLFRTYHALPEMTTRQGLHTNAVKGTLNALHKLMRRYHPTHMVVAFDTKSPTFRHEMSDLYKANRPPMDEELRQQLPYIHKLVEALGIPMLRIEGAEADDIIGTLAHQAVEQGHHVVISTGDKDMAQLVNDAVVLEDSFKGVVTDVAGVHEKFEVAPEQIIDYLTLMGDASDGIKGVPKVGKKTAAKLLKQYGSLDNILADASNIKGVVGKNLIEFADNTVTDKQMATIVTNLNLDGYLTTLNDLDNTNSTNWDALKINTDPTAHIDELRALYTELEFKKDLDSLNHPNHPANIHSAGVNTTGNHSTGVNSTGSHSSHSTHAQTAKIEAEPVAPDVPKAWHTVLDEPAFDSLLERLSSAPYFAFDTETTSLNWREAEIVGISVALQAHEAYYIPLAHGLAKQGEPATLDLIDLAEVDDTDLLASKQLNREAVLSKLKPLLENPNIGKVGQNFKYDAHVLSNYDIKLIGWHSDTMLASYVINAAATAHNMDALAKHYLHTTTIKYEDIAGKGAKQLTFDKIAIDVASDYACEDADVTLQLYNLFAKHLTQGQSENDLRLLNQLEIPTAQILTQMESHGILINRPFLAELSERFDSEISQLEQKAYQAVGEEFNIGSPKQLGEMLFDKLALKGGKKTRSGQYSTSEAVLAKIDHPVVDTVLEYRSLTKLKSTYTDALARVADSKTDRVHTSYHQALTSTGRLSSTEPNLQNIPIRTPTGRLIRQAFIAPDPAKQPEQCTTKRIIMAADYSQIELRLMAHFSADETLIESFKQGLDIHSATAAEVLGKDISEVSKAERRNAKAINFGLLYGMGAFGLAKQLGLSRSEAQDYIKVYFARYPKVQRYMNVTRAMAYDYGYIQTILGRKLYTPDIHSSKRMIKNAAERAAINAPLQGSAADIIKLAMIAVDKAFSEQGYHDHAKMLLQVHDELVFEVDEDKADEIGNVIQSAMQNVLTHTAKELGWVIDFAVPLLVEVDRGSNWDEAH